MYLSLNLTRQNKSIALLSAQLKAICKGKYALRWNFMPKRFSVRQFANRWHPSEVEWPWLQKVWSRPAVSFQIEIYPQLRSGGVIFPQAFFSCFRPLLPFLLINGYQIGLDGPLRKNPVYKLRCVGCIKNMALKLFQSWGYLYCILSWVFRSIDRGCL